MRLEEAVAVIEYHRACFKLKHAKTDEERKKLQPAVDHFKKVVEDYIKKGGFQKEK